MKQTMTAVLAAGLIIFTGVAVTAEQGRGRGGENGRPETPPGQERKVVAVPEPATLTLLAVTLGSGLLARGWASRRTGRRR